MNGSDRSVIPALMLALVMCASQGCGPHLLQRQLEAARELMRTVTLQYEEGKSDFLTYLEHLKAVKETKRDYYEASANNQTKVALLEQAIAEPLR